MGLFISKIVPDWIFVIFQKIVSFGQNKFENALVCVVSKILGLKGCDNEVSKLWVSPK